MHFPADLVTFTEEIFSGKIFYAGAIDHLEMSYLELCRYFEVIVDIVEIINLIHCYHYTQSRSFRDERLHLQE